MFPRFLKTPSFPDRVVEGSGLNLLTQERAFARAIACSARTVGPVIKRFRALVEGLNKDSVAGGGVGAFWARRVVARIRVGKGLCVRVVIITVYVGVEFRWRATIADI